MSRKNKLMAAMMLGLLETTGASFADNVLRDNCYQVSVFTSDENGAGTDANIKATFTNNDGVSANWVLNPGMSGDAFERGKTDVGVYCTDALLGVPTKLKLENDGTYSGPAWGVSSVWIEPQNQPDGSGFMNRFTFGKVIEGGKSAEMESKMFSLAPGVNLPLNDDWDVLRVTIRTGTQAGAGTDANVWMTITGPDGATDKTRMNGFFSGDAFENGDTNEKVFFVGQRIGNPSSISFQLEGAYAGNEWYLKDVKVTGRSGKLATFTVEQVLDVGNDSLKGTFPVDVPRRILEKIPGTSDKEDVRLVFDTQVQHNLSLKSQREFKLTTKVGVENSVELMDSSNKTNTQNVQVTASTGNDQKSFYKVEVTAGLEFSQSIERATTQALKYLTEFEWEQPFPIDPGYIMIVECTWAIPQRQIAVTDGQQNFFLNVASGTPSLNCGPNAVGPGDTMSAEMQKTVAAAFANWEGPGGVKELAMKAGIKMN